MNPICICTEPTALIGFGLIIFNGLKIRCYKMYRADGSMKCTKCKSSVGTTNIVATDFNPLVI